MAVENWGLKLRCQNTRPVDIQVRDIRLIANVGG